MPEDLLKEEVRRYSRHILLPQIGVEGQQKLKAGSVLIIGTGGLGSPAALYLAAAGVGTIGLVDYDEVDLSNLQRQIVHGMSSVGERKVLSAKRRLLDINPFINIVTYDEPFTAANARQVVMDRGPAGYDVVIDCTDNFPTRYLSNDLCVFLGKPNIYGAIFRFDGQVSVFDARYGPCYRCIFPEPPPPDSVPGCAISGVLGVLPGTIGTLQATEAIKVLLGIGDPLYGRLLLYSALDMTFDFVRVQKNPQCKVCGEHAEIKELIDYDEFCGVPGEAMYKDSKQIWEIEPQQAAKMRSGEAAALFVDVREIQERKVSVIPGSIHLPMGQLQRHLNELDRQRNLIFYCRSGSRSANVVKSLRQMGWENTYSLKGGINAWSKQIDDSLVEY